MIMYGRPCVMSWELDGDLGPLENEEDRDLPMEEVMERKYNIRDRSLMLQLPTSKEHNRSRQGPKMSNRNAFEVGEKVWRKNPQWNTKQKSLKKGPSGMVPMKLQRGKMVAMEITC